MHLCKQGTAKMNQMNWGRRKYVYYIMQNFFNPRESGGLSFVKQPVSRNDSLDRARWTPGWEPTLYQTSDQRRSKVLNMSVPTWCQSSQSSVSLCLSLSPTQTTITMFCIEGLIFLIHMCCCHLSLLVYNNNTCSYKRGHTFQNSTFLFFITLYNA